MALSSSTLRGPYEIQTPIGAGQRSGPAQLQVGTDWFEEMKRRVPAGEKR